MNHKHSILLLEDEPLILMDLESAAEDRGCRVLAATSCEEALSLIEANGGVDTAVLDVSLGGGKTCIPVAKELKARSIPFVLHSGDLNRHEERVRRLDAPLIAKPAPSDKVIAAAIALFESQNQGEVAQAAE